MLNKVGDIWQNLGLADAICITTNCVIKSNGRLVMGRGIAKEAVDRFPEIDLKFAQEIKKGFPVCVGSVSGNTSIVSFPTKYDWREDSDLGLIAASAEWLTRLVGAKGWKRICIPRPGCGLGRLKWENVKAVLEPIFDDRYEIWSKQS